MTTGAGVDVVAMLELADVELADVLDDDAVARQLELELGCTSASFPIGVPPVGYKTTSKLVFTGKSGVQTIHWAMIFAYLSSCV